MSDVTLKIGILKGYLIATNAPGEIMGAVDTLIKAGTVRETITGSPTVDSLNEMTRKIIKGDPETAYAVRDNETGTTTDGSDMNLSSEPPKKIKTYRSWTEEEKRQVIYGHFTEGKDAQQLSDETGIEKKKIKAKLAWAPKDGSKEKYNVASLGAESKPKGFPPAPVVEEGKPDPREDRQPAGYVAPSDAEIAEDVQNLSENVADIEEGDANDADDDDDIPVRVKRQDTPAQDLIDKYGNDYVGQRDFGTLELQDIPDIQQMLRTHSLEQVAFHYNVKVGQLKAFLDTHANPDSKKNGADIYRHG